MNDPSPINLALDVGGSTITVFIQYLSTDPSSFMQHKRFSSSHDNCLDQLLDIISDYQSKFLLTKIFVGLPGDSMVIKSSSVNLWCPPLNQFIDTNILRSFGCYLLNDTELLAFVHSHIISLHAPINSVSSLVTIGTSFGLSIFTCNSGDIDLPSITSYEIAHSLLFDYVTELIQFPFIDQPVLGSLFSVGGLFVYCYPDMPFTLDGNFIRVTKNNILQVIDSKMLSSERLREWFVLLSDVISKWTDSNTSKILTFNKPFLYSPAISLLSQSLTYSNIVRDNCILVY